MRRGDKLATDVVAHTHDEAGHTDTTGCLHDETRFTTARFTTTRFTTTRFTTAFTRPVHDARPARGHDSAVG